MLKHVSYRSSSTSLSRPLEDYSFRSPSGTSSLNRSHLLSGTSSSNFARSNLSQLDSFLSCNSSCNSAFKSYSYRGTPDSVSLTSTLSFSSLACPDGRDLSFASSEKAVPVKIYLRRLRSDMQYKTVSLSLQTTCQELVLLLLLKFRLRHRDPKLFFVLMEVTVRSPSDGSPVKRQLVLEDNARPAELQQCRPKGEANFSIGVKRGGLVRVHDSVLMPGSQYKSLMVSFDTNAEELVQLLLNCYNNPEDPWNYRVHEVCKDCCVDRALGATESPIEVQAAWPKDEKQRWMFVLRRNVSYTLRKIKSKLNWRRSLDQSSTDTDSEVDIDDHNTTRASIMSTSSTSSSTSSTSTISSSSGVSSQYSSSSATSSEAGDLITPEKTSMSYKIPLKTNGTLVSQGGSTGKLVLPGGKLSSKPPKPVPRTLFPPAVHRQQSQSTTTLTNEDDSGIVLDESDGLTPIKVEEYDQDFKPELPPRSHTISAGSPVVPVPIPVRRFSSIKSLSKSTLNLSLGSPLSSVKSKSFLNLSLSPFSDMKLPGATSTPKSTGTKEAFKSTFTGRRSSIGDLTISASPKLKVPTGASTGTSTPCACKNCFYI